MSNAGTTPPGTLGEQQAATWVRQMFSNIAPRYDFLNHLLSFNIDKAWRKVLLARVRSVLDRPGTRVLDLCCGTGDVLIDLQSVAKQPVFGADFCHPMLIAARDKISQRGMPSVLFEADALNLPMAADSLDAITISFGFRNLSNYRAGLQELYRVLKPGGVLAILEFSHPPGVFMRTAYGFYSRFVLPNVGALISGSREAYAYLPASVGKFPAAADFERMFAESGFRNCAFQLLTGGIAALHSGEKS